MSDFSEEQCQAEVTVTAAMASFLSRASCAAEKIALRSPKKVIILILKMENMNIEAAFSDYYIIITSHGIMNS